VPYLTGRARRSSADALGFWPFSSSEPARAEGELHPDVAAWQSAVKARGNAVTRMPKGPNVGKLAERYTDRQGVARYALATAAALKADGRGAAQYAADIAAGKRVEQLEQTVKVLKDGAGLALDLPRKAIGGILGIPPWAVTVLVLGGGVFAVRALLPSLPSRLGLARRNPPRRRSPRSKRRGAR
jgi:hypothetical protein